MKFSLIIATMNAGRYLERALSSILAQTFTDYEIVVQDGGSSDNTLALLGKARQDRIKLRSEPDGGIYDAWNRALDRACGDWGIFLGADDFLLDKYVLERCARHLDRLPEKIIFAYGDLVLGTKERHRYTIRRSLRAVYTMLLNHMPLPFPSTFTRMAVLKEYRFDASFGIAGDYDFAARMISADNVFHLPLTVAYQELGGISDTPENEEKLRAERLRVLNAHVLPRAEEVVRGCIKYLDENACCGSKKRVRRLERLKRFALTKLGLWRSGLRKDA
ncbi:MAG: glycosyltransferase [Desulfovibrio sp.]|nr:glycosyltransferase [Desulfovibrio sp.]